MKSKKSISFLLSLLILCSSLGLNFSVHYCNDAIASIALNASVDEPCHKPLVSCCSVANSHDDCCSNKIIKVDKNSDEVVFSNSKITFKSLVFLTQNPQVLFKTTRYNPKNEFLSFYCDSNAPPIYKLNCQLVFYA